MMHFDTFSFPQGYVESTGNAREFTFIGEIQEAAPRRTAPRHKGGDFSTYSIL